MTTELELYLRGLFRDTLDQYQEKLFVTTGRLGDWNGVVAVPNRPWHSYVRPTGEENKVLIVLNYRVPNVLNTPVLIGYSAYNPKVFQVLDYNLDSVAQGVTGEVEYPGLPVHAQTHQWMGTNGGNDIVFVQLRQFDPLRVSIASEDDPMIVRVQRGIIPLATGGWSYVESQTFDMSSYVPSTSGKGRWVLVAIGIDGAILLTSGSERGVGDLTLANIPDCEVGVLPLAAVYLYNGQTAIREDTGEVDIIDLRFPQYNRDYKVSSSSSSSSTSSSSTSSSSSSSTSSSSSSSAP